jgi:hypothetical protein
MTKKKSQPSNSQPVVKPEHKKLPAHKTPIPPTDSQKIAIKNYSKIRLSLEEISSLIDVSKRTLIRWMKRYPDLAGTIKKARTESKAHAVNNAYLRAFPLPEQVYDENGKPVYDSDGKPVKRTPKGDTVLAIFLLKTMYGFKEPERNIKISGTKGDTEILFNVSGNRFKPDELAKEITKHYDDKG